MTEAVSASGPRRAMRVATIFTGVAAATVGMTQVANAQDHRPANLQDHRPGHLRGGMLPAGRLSGSIKSSIACALSGKHKTWVHTSITNYWSSGYEYTSDCFGGKGFFTSPPFTGLRAVCGGNNHGYVEGELGGRSKSYHYGPATGYHTLDWSHFYWVTINSWTGTDGCPHGPDFGGGGMY
jgi:hypothetical protein